MSRQCFVATSHQTFPTNITLEGSGRGSFRNCRSLSLARLLFFKQRVYFLPHRFIHLDEWRPGALETFAGNFLRGVKTHFAAAGDFARRVVEHIGRALPLIVTTRTRR
jgi:hypothetical protein